jgi:hypothetical protein
MADTSAGFRYRGRKCGKPPTIQSFVAQDATTLHKGDIMNLESGEVDIGANGDTAFLGMCLETKVCDGVATTGTQVKCVCDEDAIYGVYDANARVKGALLTISGATGAQTVAAASGTDDFRVWAASSATEETLVCIAHGKHVDTVAVT